MLNRSIHLVALLMLTIAVHGQSPALQSAVTGNWKMVSVKGPAGEDCTKYYSAYDLQLKSNGTYFLSVTSSMDGTTTTEEGRFYVTEDSVISFFEIKLTVPGQNATMNDYKLKIQKTGTDVLIFSECMCGVDEDGDHFSPKCSLKYKRVK